MTTWTDLGELEGRILEAIVAADQAGEPRPSRDSLAATLALDTASIARSLQLLLDDHLVQAIDVTTFSGADWLEIRPTSEGLRAWRTRPGGYGVSRFGTGYFGDPVQAPAPSTFTLDAPVSTTIEVPPAEAAAEALPPEVVASEPGRAFSAGFSNAFGGGNFEALRGAPLEGNQPSATGAVTAEPLGPPRWLSEQEARLQEAVLLVRATTDRDVRIRAIRQVQGIVQDWADGGGNRRLFSATLSAGLDELAAFVSGDGAGADPKVMLDSLGMNVVGSSRVDLQACKLEYSIVSPK